MKPPGNTPFTHDSVGRGMSIREAPPENERGSIEIMLADLLRKEDSPARWWDQDPEGAIIEVTSGDDLAHALNLKDWRSVNLSFARMGMMVLGRDNVWPAYIKYLGPCTPDIPASFNSKSTTVLPRRLAGTSGEESARWKWAPTGFISEPLPLLKRTGLPNAKLAFSKLKGHHDPIPGIPAGLAPEFMLHELITQQTHGAEWWDGDPEGRIILITDGDHLANVFRRKDWASLNSLMAKMGIMCIGSGRYVGQRFFKYLGPSDDLVQASFSRSGATRLPRRVENSGSGNIRPGTIRWRNPRDGSLTPPYPLLSKGILPRVKEQFRQHLETLAGRKNPYSVSHSSVNKPDVPSATQRQRPSDPLNSYKVGVEFRLHKLLSSSTSDICGWWTPDPYGLMFYVLNGGQVALACGFPDWTSLQAYLSNIGIFVISESAPNPHQWPKTLQYAGPSDTNLSCAFNRQMVTRLPVRTSPPQANETFWTNPDTKQGFGPYPAPHVAVGVASTRYSQLSTYLRQMAQQQQAQQAQQAMMIQMSNGLKVPMGFAPSPNVMAKVQSNGFPLPYQNNSSTVGGWNGSSNNSMNMSNNTATVQQMLPVQAAIAPPLSPPAPIAPAPVAPAPISLAPFAPAPAAQAPASVDVPSKQDAHVKIDKSPEMMSSGGETNTELADPGALSTQSSSLSVALMAASLLALPHIEASWQKRHPADPVHQVQHLAGMLGAPLSLSLDSIQEALVRGQAIVDQCGPFYQEGLDTPTNPSVPETSPTTHNVVAEEEQKEPIYDSFESDLDSEQIVEHDSDSDYEQSTRRRKRKRLSR